MTMLAVLLLSLAVGAEIEDPCWGMTLGDCEIGDDNIIDRKPFDAFICAETCKMSDNCHFWRVYNDCSMDLPECLHIGTDYHKVKRAELKRDLPCFRTVPALGDP